MACQPKSNRTNRPELSIRTLSGDIAMDEPVSVEPAQYARKVAKRIAEARNRILVRAARAEERKAGHQFHGEEPEVTVLRLIELDQVRMPQGVTTGILFERKRVSGWGSAEFSLRRPAAFPVVRFVHSSETASSQTAADLEAVWKADIGP
jgi:hypothetical protein